MFEHQIIEDLKTRSRDRALKSSNYRNEFMRIENDIMAAHRFHIGEIEPVFDMFMGRPDNEFIEMSKSYGRLPYKQTYLEYLMEYFPGNKTKVGLLIDEFNAPICAVRIIVKIKEWFFVPVYYAVSLNALPLKDNPGTEKWQTEPQDAIFCPRPFDCDIEHDGTFQKLQPFLDLQIWCIYPILFLLHCKNINKEKTNPSRALNTKRKKAGRTELLSFYTLKLRLPGKKQSGHIAKSKGGSNRLHFCRGHFKRRKTGLYYWQPHIRGRNKKGVVLKDYEVCCENNTSVNC